MLSVDDGAGGVEAVEPDDAGARPALRRGQGRAGRFVGADADPERYLPGVVGRPGDLQRVEPEQEREPDQRCECGVDRDAVPGRGVDLPGEGEQAVAVDAAELVDVA